MKEENPGDVELDETSSTSEGANKAKANGNNSNREKLCSVCGDKALGYNFNALTCESCKAFFRRNAVKNKDFKCPFSSNCEVTVVTRYGYRVTSIRINLVLFSYLDKFDFQTFLSEVQAQEVLRHRDEEGVDPV